MIQTETSTKTENDTEAYIWRRQRIRLKIAGRLKDDSGTKGNDILQHAPKERLERQTYREGERTTYRLRRNQLDRRTAGCVPLSTRRADGAT